MDYTTTLKILTVNINNKYMKIKRIEFMEEITDVDNDNIDVLVENEDGYKYIIGVGTPQDLLEEMNQEKVNCVRPGTPKIIIKNGKDEKKIKTILSSSPF